jgi:hypothetical protein
MLMDNKKIPSQTTGSITMCFQSVLHKKMTSQTARFPHVCKVTWRVSTDAILTMSTCPLITRQLSD